MSILIMIEYTSNQEPVVYRSLNYPHNTSYLSEIQDIRKNEKCA